MDYDPNIISYEQLLEAFWSGHDATQPPESIQYRSAIFYTSDQQQKAAIASKLAVEARLGKTVYTDIEPYTDFFVAEDYHQKFYLRESPDLANEILSIYPDPADFRDSTASARLNGYLGGYGDPDSLKNNLDSLGLSESGKLALLRIAESGLIPGCPVTISRGQ